MVYYLFNFMARYSRLTNEEMIINSPKMLTNIAKNSLFLGKNKGLVISIPKNATINILNNGVKYMLGSGVNSRLSKITEVFPNCFLIPRITNINEIIINIKNIFDNLNDIDCSAMKLIVSIDCCSM